MIGPFCIDPHFFYARKVQKELPAITSTQKAAGAKVTNRRSCPSINQCARAQSTNGFSRFTHVFREENCPRSLQRSITPARVISPFETLDPTSDPITPRCLISLFTRGKKFTRRRGLARIRPRGRRRGQRARTNWWLLIERKEERAQKNDRFSKWTREVGRL